MKNNDRDTLSKILGEKSTRSLERFISLTIEGLGKMPIEHVLEFVLHAWSLEDHQDSAWTKSFFNRDTIEKSDVVKMLKIVQNARDDGAIEINSIRPLRESLGLIRIRD